LVEEPNFGIATRCSSVLCSWEADAMKRVVGRIFFSGWLLAVSCVMVIADGPKVAKYAGEFIAIGVGGRALGMGGAFVALANDVTAGYWNPAGLSKITYTEITLMHDERFASLVNYDYGAVAFPSGSKASIGFSVIRLGIDGIPDTREALYDGSTLDQARIYDIFNPNARIDPNRVTYFNSADWAFYFTYAKNLSEDFSYGANLKVIRRDMGSNSATGIGFDLGGRLLLTENLVLGVNLQDITTTLIAWDTGTKELISPTAKIGSAYFIDLFGGRIAPAVDFDVRFENRRYASTTHVGPVSADLHAGLEYDFKNLVAVRVGYNDVKQVTIGAGLHLPKLDVDYSFARFAALPSTERLPDTHRISLKLTLSEDRFRRSVE
jgi:hypothetical protein